MVKKLFGCKNFITQFPSLNFHNSSLITHHLIFHTRLASSLIFHHSIFVTLFVGLIPVTWCSFFFLVHKLTEPSKKIKKELNPEKPSKKKKEKKKKLNPQKPSQKKNPMKEQKKKRNHTQ